MKRVDRFLFSLHRWGEVGPFGWSFHPEDIPLPRLQLYWWDDRSGHLDFSYGTAHGDPIVSLNVRLPVPRWLSDLFP
jgi:hypothetical protein